MTNWRRLSRRTFLGGSIGVAGLASNVLAMSANPLDAHASSAISNTSDMASMDTMSNNSPKTGKIGNTSQASNATTPPSATTVPKAPVPTPTPSLPFMTGDVDPKVNGFDPMKILTDFDGGRVSKLP